MAVELRKPGFAFSEVATLLAAMFHVHPAKLDTFKSRLQQLQKAGLPAGANFGRGAKIRYINWQVADLALMLTLLHIGVPPGLLSEHYGSVHGRGGMGVYPIGGNAWKIQRSLEPDAKPLFVALHFNALGYLTREEANARPAFYEQVMSSPVPQDLLAPRIGIAAAVVNLTEHLRQLRSAVELAYPDRLEDITFVETPSGYPEE